MSYDAVVVGAGYWGVATALMAERRGATVLLVGSERPEAASPAASGHFAFGWYKGPWLPRARRAYEQASLAGLYFRHTGAIINTGRQRERGDFYSGRHRDDWYTFQPGAYLGLRRPDLADNVDAVGSDGPGQAWAVVAGRRLAARCVIVVAGSWTDELLSASGLPPIGVTALRGQGAVFKGRPPLESQVLVHQVSPFKRYVFREWGDGLYRVGETVEKTPEVKSSEYLRRMLRQVRGHLPDYDWTKPVEVIAGRRPLVDGGPTVREVAHGVIAATGGGSVGGVLGFWAAEQALRMGGIE